MKDLTKEKLELIIFSLNQTFNDAHKKLKSEKLGDIEKSLLKSFKEDSHKLILKLEKYV